MIATSMVGYTERAQVDKDESVPKLRVDTWEINQAVLYSIQQLKRLNSYSNSHLSNPYRIGTIPTAKSRGV